ncbi:MAG: hypothetical protein IKE94_01710 [Aeriscardovia sp.]|nr:hypothetical protein [Aeriscardovia sp.]
MYKKCISVLVLSCFVINITACNVVETAKEKASSAKDSVVAWYENLDFSKFEDGWNNSKEYVGAQYSAVVSSEYVANVQTAITQMGENMNSAMGSARGTAQEAGYLAEQWAADTFNINSIASGSAERANVVGSNELGSVDVTTTYGEQASLKYYADASSSAQAQAQDLLSRYYQYCSKSKNPKTFPEYMNDLGYDPDTMDELMASLTPVYDGQTRIIPADQLQEATAYLQGRIDTLSATGENAAVYQETLDRLSDRLRSSKGVESKPITREELMAATELAQSGKFKPEDFGIKLSQVISPKYVLKLAMGTGLATATLNTVFTVGPDFYTIIKNSIEAGGVDEAELKKVGLEAAIAASEGFVEGSVCSAVTTLCQAGTFGATLQNASPNVVATITVIIIEAAINGYKLSQGKMTTEEYGNMMADKVMIGLISIPTVELMIAVCAALKMPMLVGCIAGSLIACIGYTIAKEAVLDIVDGGGFEAIVPAKTSDALSVAKDYISNLNIKERASSFGDTVVSTANDGFVRVKAVFE